ncbi:hypothetical protein [Rubrivirga sp.]|uniref:hypothetical protein n=1 Tax=Rubrivirga sp. TaxID=1885344 RepID=UPI003C72E3F0
MDLDDAPDYLGLPPEQNGLLGGPASALQSLGWWRAPDWLLPDAEREARSQALRAEDWAGFWEANGAGIAPLWDRYATQLDAGAYASLRAKQEDLARELADVREREAAYRRVFKDKLPARGEPPNHFSAGLNVWVRRGDGLDFQHGVLAAVLEEERMRGAVRAWADRTEEEKRGLIEESRSPFAYLNSVLVALAEHGIGSLAELEQKGVPFATAGLESLPGELPLPDDAPVNNSVARTLRREVERITGALPSTVRQVCEVALQHKRELQAKG